MIIRSLKLIILTLTFFSCSCQNESIKDREIKSPAKKESPVIENNANSMTENIKVNRQLAEELIRKTESAYDQAWKQGDIEGIMKCFTSDAVLISPRGDVAIGAEQIRTLLSNFLKNEAKNSIHTSRINRISFVTDNVAVVDGEAFIESEENLAASVKHHNFTDILVFNGEVWLISQIRAHAID